VRLCGLLVCLTALSPTGAHADQCQTRLPVSAVVVPAASLTVAESPSSILVTSADVRRGRKTFRVRYHVSGNSHAGYLLRVVPHVGLTSQIVLRGLQSNVLVLDDSVEVSLPSSAGDVDLSLEIELQLMDGTPPGRYPLPLSLSLSPIPAAA
jgi:hypothetical protein